MAIKGIGVDPNIFVDQTYYIPGNYTAPAPSSGDYATPQSYFEEDYVLNAQDLLSTFTFSAEGTVFSISASHTSTATMSVSAQRFRGTAGTQQLVTVSTVSCDAIDLSIAIVPVVRMFAPRFLRAIQTTIGHMPPASWNTFAESEYIDRTWDEINDGWDYLSDVYIRSNFTKTLGGYLAKATATLSAEFTTTISIDRLRTAVITPPSVSTMSVNANYVGTGVANPIAVNSVTATGARYRGVAISGQPYNITAVGSISANAIYTAIGTGGFTTLFTQTTQGNAIYDPTKQINSVFTQSANANVDYVGTAAFTAFYSQLAVGRLILIPDPWNVIKVKQEIRTLVAPQDTRTLPVLEETRVNSVEPETRGFQVLEETKAYKIFKPQFTNRSSIPRVRQEP